MYICHYEGKSKAHDSSVQCRVLIEESSTFQDDHDENLQAPASVVDVQCSIETTPKSSLQHPNDERSIKSQRKRISTLLFHVKDGSLENVRRCYEHGMDMSQADYDSRTALHIASAEGHVTIVRFLLECCGVDPLLKDRWEFTAYDESVRCGFTDIAAILQQQMAKQKSEYEILMPDVTLSKAGYMNPSMKAIDDSHVAPEAGKCQINASDDKGRPTMEQKTALSLMLFTVQEGDIDEIKRYRESGMDMSLADYDGRTALHVASADGHTHIVVFLLGECGLDPLTEDRWKYTALSEAYKFNHMEVVLILETHLSIYTRGTENGAHIAAEPTVVVPYLHGRIYAQELCDDLVKEKGISVKYTSDYLKRYGNYKVTEKEASTISQVTGLNWELLGPSLGIRNATIEQIKMDNQNKTALQIFNMLVKWIEKEGAKATFNVLFQAFSVNPSVTFDPQTPLIKNMFQRLCC